MIGIDKKNRLGELKNIGTNNMTFDELNEYVQLRRQIPGVIKGPKSNGYYRNLIPDPIEMARNDYNHSISDFSRLDALKRIGTEHMTTEELMNYNRLKKSQEREYQERLKQQMRKQQEKALIQRIQAPVPKPSLQPLPQVNSSPQPQASNNKKISDRNKGLDWDDLDYYADSVNDGLDDIDDSRKRAFFEKDLDSLIRMEGFEEIAALPEKHIKVILKYVAEMRKKSSKPEQSEPIAEAIGSINGQWMPDYAEYESDNRDRDIDIYTSFNQGAQNAALANKYNIDKSRVSRIMKAVGIWLGDKFEDVTLVDLRKYWSNPDVDPDWMCADPEKDIIRVNPGVPGFPDIKVTLVNKNDEHAKKTIFYNAKTYYPKGNPASIIIPIGHLEDKKNEMHAEIKAARELHDAVPEMVIEVKARINEHISGRIFPDEDVDWQAENPGPIKIPLRDTKKSMVSGKISAGTSAV